MKQAKIDRLIHVLMRRWLTPLEAVYQTGLFSLAQRVSELRAAGVIVEDKWVRTGGGSRVKAYRIRSKA